MNHDPQVDDQRNEADHLLSDRELLRLIAARDERAFLELYQRYHGPLFNYLLRLIWEPAVAEELLQEVFVAIWRGAGRYRGQAHVRTWAFRIAHNQAVSWLRRHRPLVGLPEGLQEHSAAGDPPAQAEAAWRAEQVRQAMQQLSPNHRAVVELAFVYAFSYAEIAAIMDCPVGTVKSRMSHALRHLAGLLAAMGYEASQD